MNRRQTLHALQSLCLGAIALTSLKTASQVPSTSRAPEWPQQPLRIIVVYPVGGISDTVARALADKLARQLGVPVRVENRAGLGGSLGMEALARSAPDGYTLAFSAISPLSLTPHLGKVSYDPFKDIAPVMSVMHTPVLLVGTPAFAGDNFQALLTQSRAGRGGLRWATSGQATIGHLVLEQVRLASGADLVHIPYKGGGQQLNDALSGQFELLSTNMGAAQMQYIRAGKFKPLAVGSPERLKRLPDVPTFAELGFAQANLSSLFGLFAPAGTPEPILQRLNVELNQALRLPDIRNQLVSVDNIPTGGTAAAFSQQIAQEWQSNQKLVRAGNIRGE
jgi:tripartite-type tricarboxylate transporter receptor subunit TctC